MAAFLSVLVVLGVAAAAAAGSRECGGGLSWNSQVYSTSFQAQISVAALQNQYLYYMPSDLEYSGFFINAQSAIGNVDLFISRASVHATPGYTQYEYTTQGQSYDSIRIPFNDSVPECYVIAVRSFSLSTISVDVQVVSIPKDGAVSCEALTGSAGLFGDVDQMESASSNTFTYIYYNAVAGQNFTIIANPNDDSVDVFQMFVSRASYTLKPDHTKFDAKSTFYSGLQLVTVSPEHSECYAIGFVSDSVAFFNVRVSEKFPESAVCAYQFGSQISGQVFGTPTLTDDIAVGTYQYYYYSAASHRKIDISILPGSDFVEVSVDKAEDNLRPRFFNAEVSSYYTGNVVSFSTGSLPVCFSIAVYGKEKSRYTLEFSTSELRSDSSKSTWPPIYGVWIAFAFVAGVTLTASCLFIRRRSILNTCSPGVNSGTLGYTQAPTSDADVDAVLMNTDDLDAGQVKLRTSDHY